MLWCGQHNDSYWLHATFVRLLRELLIWNPTVDDDLWPAVSLHMISLQPWWQWAPISWCYFFRYVCQESVIRESGSDGTARRSHTWLTVMDCHAKGSGGDNGSLQFHRMGKIGFLLPVAHYRYSLRFHQSGHMRVVRKTEWRKMSPELQKWGEIERRNKQEWKGNMLSKGKTPVTDIIKQDI